MGLVGILIGIGWCFLYLLVPKCPIIWIFIFPILITFDVKPMYITGMYQYILNIILFGWYSLRSL